MDDTTTTQDGTPEQETGKGLRAQLEKVLAENKKPRSDKLASTFNGIGLSVEAGLGKAIAKEYDGELSVDAVAAYAESEYGYVKPEATHQAAQQIAQEQARLDTVGQVTTPVQPVNTNERLAKAEAEGDYMTASAIKAAQMQQMMARQNR